MDIEGLRTLYVARVVDIPPLTAAVAFDEVVPSAAPATYAIRRAEGRLSISRHVRVGVELELVRWSRTSCEVGVRPLGRVPFAGGWRQRHYLDAAGLEATRLADAMTATVESWTAVAWAVASHPSRSVA
jgi:hypothetical protein